MTTSLILCEALKKWQEDKPPEQRIRCTCGHELKPLYDIGMVRLAICDKCGATYDKLPSNVLRYYLSKNKEVLK